MAIISCCAIDWSFDQFYEDMKSVTALPLRNGVYSAKNLTEGQKLCQWLKTEAKFYAADNQKNGVYLNDTYEYVGDSFANRLGEMLFSDWYKDAYNQRPHFDKAFVSMLCGLPVFYEEGFCDDGKRQLLQNEVRIAKTTRMKLTGELTA